ncbi:hypothetical protein M2447_002450 [Ereboglobus sp. PH5-10]|uniref:M12 family metallo-peptidase n=1 Tax=Ereboglobus sp. PH5-10 TaxID=2940629 RepID=UPI002405F950|nr:M12 family metallo-peptidase [Ereboglobus sp. PH5-10]MDF9828332.1 hypothetical protein [Ereboglobus sp. PH5-10]
MSGKNRQRLVAGVALTLALSCGAYLLWQTGAKTRHSPAMAGARVDAAPRALPAATSATSFADRTPETAPALAQAAPAVASNAGDGGAQSTRRPQKTLRDADVVNVREILPGLEGSVANWTEYTPELLTIALPSGRTVDFAMTSVRAEHDRTIWNGRSDADDASAFLVTVATRDTWFTATTDPETGDNVVYYITGMHARRLVAAPSRAACGTGASPVAMEAPPALQSQAGAPEVLAASSSYTVDVLFFYDQTALDTAGGSSDYVKSWVVGYLESSNLALGNSLVNNFRWRFAGIYQLPAYDDGEDLDAEGSLSAISSQQGAVGSFVHQKAQYHSADQVCVFFGVDDDTAAGIAQCPGHYAAVHFGPSVGYTTLAHELGHNFGCYHDRDEAAAGGTDDDGYYNYGHIFTVSGSGSFGTIMSYAGTSLYPGSRRIAFFSNPSVTYLGVPTGLPEGDPRAADNARFLREEAPEMASYRSAPATAPFISTHPRSGHYAVDSTITLTVVATADQAFYQWKKGGKAIAGATDLSYVIDSAQESHAGRYTVTVSNIKGSVTSNEAVIGVGGDNGWGWGYGTGESDLGGDDVSGGGGAPGLYYLSVLLMLALVRLASSRRSQ